MKQFSQVFVRLNSSTASSKWKRFVPSDGVYPRGFQAGAVGCGIKPSSLKLDLAVLVSERPCNAAGVFTKNHFQAAPVQVSRQVLQQTHGENIHAVVVNSGCANAITGQQGHQDAQEMVGLVDENLPFSTKNTSNSTLVMSTGVIGQLLPMDKIRKGIKSIFSSTGKSTLLGPLHQHWEACARGLMTTDTFPKMASREVTLGPNGPSYRIAGLAKGAGMISPNMATLIGCLVTDAPVTSGALATILKHAVDRSFNCISVDGDMSTNDTIVALANGAAANSPAGDSTGKTGDITIPTITEQSPEFSGLRDEFTAVAAELAQLVVRDGEGTTKFVTLNVTNCANYVVAKKIAASIANSALVKTALYGNDANWGRILAAIGYVDLGGASSAPLDLEKISVSFVPTKPDVAGPEPLKLLVKGEPQQVDEVRAKKILSLGDLEVLVDIGDEKNGASCKYWTCDLSHDYVTINADYRS